jgi:hypothetical protein
MHRPRLALLTAVLPLSAACIERPVSKVDPRPENIENLEFTVDVNPNLDLLFVIDDSRSMRNEQEQITANFPRMIQVLETLPDGLPDLHLGVISTDVGAGGACNDPDPGPGVLRNDPTVDGCAPPSDRWISDVDDGTGTGGRDRNYGATLGDTFACIATLGTGGCGYEQPLESIRRALSPSTLENDGFLRDDSLLAVVILSDEDDCSAFDTDLFDAPTPDGVDGDFRCFAEGVRCDGPPEQLGTREHCVARDDSPYITPVDDFVRDLRAVRPQQSRLLVAGILGDTEVTVGPNDDDDLDVLPSCHPDADNPEGAYPPTRTDAFLAQFPSPIRERICAADLTPAIVAIGAEIVNRLYGGCIRGELATPDAPDCAVTEIQHPGTPEASSSALAHCDAADGEAATNKPCWTVDVDPICSTDSNLRVTTHYDDPRDPDTLIDAQCRLAPGA